MIAFIKYEIFEYSIWELLYYFALDTVKLRQIKLFLAMPFSKLITHTKMLRSLAATSWELLEYLYCPHMNLTAVFSAKVNKIEWQWGKRPSFLLSVRIKHDSSTVHKIPVLIHILLGLQIHWLKTALAQLSPIFFFLNVVGNQFTPTQNCLPPVHGIRWLKAKIFHRFGSFLTIVGGTG